MAVCLAGCGQHLQEDLVRSAEDAGQRDSACYTLDYAGAGWARADYLTGRRTGPVGDYNKVLTRKDTITVPTPRP